MKYVLSIYERRLIVGNVNLIKNEFVIQTMHKFSQFTYQSQVHHCEFQIAIKLINNSDTEAIIVRS